MYAWGIVKALYTYFKKTSAEFTAKLAIKCSQIVVYELLGVSVTESFAIHELNASVDDPILDELFPA